MQNIEFITFEDILPVLRKMQRMNPLIHCMTNEVVQEITANVLLAAGASPAMVVANQEAEQFVRNASALLINLGTPYESRLVTMRSTVKSAKAAHIPWVLDPVAAGGIPWRNEIIKEFVSFRPTAIRGNASEILYLAGQGSGGKGVDSTASSDQAVNAAVELARQAQTIVVVTGEVDYATDGERILASRGGHPMITKVVGTGCSLSALVAAFIASSADDPLFAAISCCSYVNKAGEIAGSKSQGPGSFHNHYLDALFAL